MLSDGKGKSLIVHHNQKVRKGRRNAFLWKLVPTFGVGRDENASFHNLAFFFFNIKPKCILPEKLHELSACVVNFVFLLFFYRSFSFMYFRFLVCHYFLFFVNYFILNYFWNIISWATSACSNSGYLSISLFSPSSYVSILQICEHTKRSWEPGLWRWRRGI